MKQDYTLEDIARELGLSKSTVSRAISGKGRLSEETRRRVLDFSEKHNYRPNAVAKSLAQNRTYNLGLMLSVDEHGVDLPFFHECSFGVCQVAAEHGYDVLLNINQENILAHLRRMIQNRKVDGIIAGQSQVDSPIPALLRKENVPCVLIGATEEEGVLTVDNNNQGACRDLVTLLIARGSKRMALLGGDESLCVTHSRKRGFEEACTQAGLSLQDQMIFLGVDSSAKVVSAIKESLQGKVDCILCMDDLICFMVLTQLREARVSIPEDIKIVCFYDSALLENASPSVTALRFNSVELGRTACRELIRVLEGEEGKSQVLPGFQMILRDSTK